MKLVHDFVFPSNLHFNQLFWCYAVSNLFLFQQTFILLCHNDYWIRKWWWNRVKSNIWQCSRLFPTMRTLKRRSICFVLQEVSRNIHRDNQCNNFTLNLYEILRQQKVRENSRDFESAETSRVFGFLGRVLLFPLECPPWRHENFF
jgi:hypothetical protein